MNRVAVNSPDFPLPGWGSSLKKFAKKVLGELGINNWELSVMLCADDTIRVLNSRFRGKNQATDVLSFTQTETNTFPDKQPGSEGMFIPGDIVISLDSLEKNALRFRVSEDEELRRLLIHGILHLDGKDHQSNRRTEPMLLLQEQILAKFADVHIMEFDS